MLNFTFNGENKTRVLHGGGGSYKISIENVGDPGSEIDWEISEYPSWGTWTFIPPNGIDLTPEDGPLTIDVEVVAPVDKNEDFSGYVKIVDINDNTNSCLIHVTLATPKTQIFINQIFQQFLENHPLLFPILRYLLGL